MPAVPYCQSEQLRAAIPRRWPKQIARKIEPNGAIWANQFDNVANRRAISRRPARKSGEQTDGKVDGFRLRRSAPAARSPASAIALKERNKNVHIALADPMGAALYSYYTTGKLKAEGTSITEGIGQGRITKNLEGAPIDGAYQMPDEEALPIMFDLAGAEGLCLGGSSGINIAGAVRLAKELGPGHTIVTILADYGTRYQSKLFNPRIPALEEPAGAAMARARSKSRFLTNERSRDASRVIANLD